MTRANNWPPALAWLSVAVAGFIGTEVRYGLGLLFPESSSGFPFTTLVINLCGSFALAWLTGFWVKRPAPWWLRAALGPGLLGSFTTFSAVIYAVHQLAGQALPGVWIPYLLITLAAGLCAAFLGLGLGERSGKRYAARPRSES